MLGAVGVLAALVGRGVAPRDAGPGGGGGQRIDVSLLGSTLASLVNQAQNAFVDRASRPAGAATRTRTSSRTRRSRPRTARSRSRSGPSGSGRGSATRSGSPDLADGSALRDERRPGRAPRRAAADPRRPVPRARHGRVARRRSRRPTSRAARSATSSRPSPRPRRSALGMTVELEHPAWGVIRQVGVPFALSATPATIRLAAARCSAQDTRRGPARARLRAGRDRGASCVTA